MSSIWAPNTSGTVTWSAPIRASMYTKYTGKQCLNKRPPHRIGIPSACHLP